jgi:hypothetical protein
MGQYRFKYFLSQAGVPDSPLSRAILMVTGLATPA